MAAYMVRGFASNTDRNICRLLIPADRMVAYRPPRKTESSIVMFSYTFASVRLGWKSSALNASENDACVSRASQSTCFKVTSFAPTEDCRLTHAIGGDLIATLLTSML